MKVEMRINISAINKQYAFRQVSASNPPQRKVANRYASLLAAQRLQSFGILINRKKRADEYQ